MSVTAELPPGWAHAPLDALVTYPAIRTKIKQRDYAAAGALRVVDQGDGLASGSTDELSAAVEEPPPIIAFGDHTRRLKYIDFPFAAGADGLKLLKPRAGVNAKWLYWALRAADLPDRGYGRHFQFLKALTLRVPPRPEQDRIVELLEAHLAAVAAGVSAFERVADARDRFVDALYASAFRGELVRSSHRLGPSGFPAHWEVTPLGTIAERVTSGSRDWKPYYGRGDGVFVLTQNVRPRALDLSEPFHVDPPSTDAAVSRSAIRHDDLLITIVGANVGNTARVPCELPRHYVCQSLALVRLAEPSLSTFLELYVTSPSGGQRYFEKCFYGQGRPHISFDDLKSMPVPIPPAAEERQAIVQAFDAQYAAAKELHEVVASVAREADVLKTSLVRAAATGELSEQRHADGTAEELLAELAATAREGRGSSVRRSKS